MDKKLIIRLVVLVLVLLNTVLALCGVTAVNVSDNTVYEIVSVSATIVVALWNAYKNNNFTTASKLAQSVLDALKDGSLSQDRVEEILKESKDKTSE